MPSSDAANTIPFIKGAMGSWRVSVGRVAYSGDDLARLYDSKARQWSRSLSRLGLHAAYQSAALWSINRYFAGHAGRPLRVLDCGIGDGAFATSFARVWRGPLDFHGIDRSKEMLAQARAKLAAQGVEATLWSADACDLPFENGAFDIVLSAHMLEHLARPELAVSEIYRVLKPEGIFVAALTRRSLFGRLIQLRWRTHIFDEERAAVLLGCAAFETVHIIPQHEHFVSNRLSIFSAARKPAPKQILSEDNGTKEVQS
ncbi:MAG: class I SAM-dependent methyltransferase [Pseudomonadota bacterium]